MALLHLHSYPRAFNNSGNMRAFPIRRGIRLPVYGMAFMGWTLYLSYDIFLGKLREFPQGEFFTADREWLLLQKRGFDTLILANRPTTPEDAVSQRSIF